MAVGMLVGIIGLGVEKASRPRELPAYLDIWVDVPGGRSATIRLRVDALDPGGSTVNIDDRLRVRDPNPTSTTSQAIFSPGSGP